MSRRILVVLMAAVLMIGAGFIVGCGSSGGGGGLNIPFPTGADEYEGATGDDTWETANDFAVGDSKEYTLWKFADNDYIKVTLVAGTKYEFTVDQVSVNQDTTMELFDIDGTNSLDSNSHCVSYYDSCMTYTPTVSGDYYVAAYGKSIYERTAYTFSVREFVDADKDGFSDYYDCDDTDDEVFPSFEWSVGGTEIMGDGIDQDCDGIDAPLLTADAGEPDDTIQTAKSLEPVTGSYYEMPFRTETTEANVRTLYNAPSDDPDMDYFKLVLPANSFYMIAGHCTVNEFENSIDTRFDIYESIDDEAPSEGNSGTVEVFNETDKSVTYYFAFYAENATENGTYLPCAIFQGYDLDGDGYNTMENEPDCDDSDATIHPYMEEDSAVDGIDQNCDGLDGTHIYLQD